MSGPWQRREVIGDCVLYLGDSAVIQPALDLPDAVVTDPPYGIGAKMVGSGPFAGLCVAMGQWDLAPPP